MTNPDLRRVNRRIASRIGVLAACVGVAVWIRAVVAADTLGDAPAVALQIGGLLAIAGAAVFAVSSGVRAPRRRERVASRTVLVGLLLVGAVFIRASYVDVSVALEALRSPDEAAPTSIVLGPTGRDVRLTGELTEGAARRLAALLAAHPEVARLHLTSEGGLVDEGDALRKVIAAHRLTTFVPDYCVSACTLAFLGGRERLIMAETRLGFHAAFETGLFGQIFKGDAGTERAAYLAAGVAPDFVDDALAVDPAEIWTPEADRLVAAGVVTALVGRYRFPDSNLDGIATLAGARATVLRNFPQARALDRTRPQDVDVLAGWYLEAYRRGLSEGQVVDGLRSIVGAAVTALARTGDDKGRILETAMRAATAGTKTR